MKKFTLILMGMLVLPLHAKDVTQKKVEMPEQEVKPSICYATVLNRFRGIVYSFCLDEDSQSRILEYSQAANGRLRKPYRCWAVGKYSGSLSENNLLIEGFEGECNIKKNLKARNLSCVKKDKGELACNFADKKNKSYRFTKAKLVRKPDRKLCEKDNKYLSENRLACQTHFGMESGVDLKDQKRIPIRMRAETRHNTK